MIIKKKKTDSIEIIQNPVSKNDKSYKYVVIDRKQVFGFIDLESDMTIMTLKIVE